MKRLALAFALLTGGAQAGERVDIARWAAALPPHYRVHGVKTEPTYEEAVDIERDDDVFAVTGGAPGWAERSTERVAVSPEGAMLRRPCGEREGCALAHAASGFLAGASLVSALRRGALQGSETAQAFGDRHIICLDALMLGIDRPILDPCFDRETGAPLAERHRLSGRLDGPTLEAYSVRVD